MSVINQSAVLSIPRSETIAPAAVPCDLAVQQARRAWSHERIRTTFVLLAIAASSVIFGATQFVWQSHPAQSSAVAPFLHWGSVLWLILGIPAAANALGIMVFRHAHQKDHPHDRIDVLVSVRIVTRGDNHVAVARTVAAARRELLRMPLFWWTIEVVTDQALPLDLGSDVVQIVVPDDYETVNGSAFKARALQYAVEHSPLGDDAWVLHLDEETHITPSAIVGVRNTIEEEEASGRHRIGQGTILYHRDLELHPVLTLADSLRTADDLGRFHLQARLGRTLFGLHGSYILVRNSVERAVGFDFGPQGSITEDAWWALLQMERGARCRWVDGHCVEQSTRSTYDFLKQRRRWFIGLLAVARHAPVSPLHRLGLRVSMALWTCSWLGVLLGLVGLVAGMRAPLPVYVLGTLALGTYVALYLVGLAVNLHDHKVPRLTACKLYLLQVVMIPLFSVLEASAVMFALLRPERGFHVVTKQ